MDKGKATHSLLLAPAFQGKFPIFIGDDITDEDGFRAVNALGGMSIKIGDGPTVAQYQFKNTGELQSWLQQLTHLLSPHH